MRVKTFIYLARVSWEINAGRGKGGPFHPRKKTKPKPVCLFEFRGRPLKLAKFHWNQ